MDGIVPQFTYEPIIALDDCPEFTLSEDQGLARVTTPATDLLSKTIDLPLPALIARHLVWTDNEDVKVAVRVRL
ncbi:hypothetical protein MLP_36190 [Microlunatus phosphovorus NM-1]|uniref:Uncharacterized protein n=1 Tax=Microlunatus phosphovorus (strain ATCC 700054 / DSM 10555 / JCM 9379 / NBRC 101784 / NCIMB 13414 / VKM Ac-1990 / NM-1) TaxID=1032480 RepID=F5XNZ3_MICPN|nr:hypothetical protein MLP_36190 [Microlunatus phosphovorus NM-1]